MTRSEYYRCAYIGCSKQFLEKLAIPVYKHNPNGVKVCSHRCVKLYIKFKPAILKKRHS